MMPLTEALATIRNRCWNPHDATAVSAYVALRDAIKQGENERLATALEELENR